MLTLQFIPYREIEYLDSQKRIKKLLKIVKENKIVLLEGRLHKTEEAELIKRTMQEIDSNFKGIEISVVYPDTKEGAFIKRIKESVINILLGDRRGMTIIGPAAIIKEIKHDPDKIQLLTEDGLKEMSRRRRKKK
ncbi:DUF2073 domain-containing protein [Candidatus Woesearchaeota archaeon]|nr:MAG: DUF2073 domain-containing protein [Candidatus Woesearchaeota archaeon]